MSKPELYTITGPTASGKTHFALQLARRIKSLTGKEVEIISADSRQIYKHIPITTAQPSQSELSEFRHHFISELELDEEFSSGLYGSSGRKIIEKIYSEDKIPIVCGGSGLYVYSLLYGMFEYGLFEFDDNELKRKIKSERNKLYGILESEGIEALVNLLKESDPRTMESLNLKGITSRRLIRALEVYFATGIPMSVFRSKKPDIRFKPVLMGLNLRREDLYKRINQRTENMLASGMIEEIELLHKKGFHYSKYNSLNTVGVREVMDYLEGILSYDEMKELIKRNTRRFAKRQLTWFRRDKNITWLDAENETERMIENISKSLSSAYR